MKSELQSATAIAVQRAQRTIPARSIQRIKRANIAIQSGICATRMKMMAGAPGECVSAAIGA